MPMRRQDDIGKEATAWLLLILLLLAILGSIGECSEARAQAPPPTPVPVLYKMFDYGTDYQTLHPEYGAVGSYQWVLWRDISPARGVNNWTLVDANLAKEQGLRVTLPDGTEVDKPVLFMALASLSGAPGWPATFYDGTPQWVYQQMGDRPTVNGRLVGHALEGCGLTAVVPAYESSTWRTAYYDTIRALGKRYDGHPQVSAVVVGTGLDGETQIVKNWGCNWAGLVSAVPGLGSGFGTFVEGAMIVYRESFPTTPVYIANAPGGSGMREWTSSIATSHGVGLKPNAGQVDGESHRGYGNFWGLWDPPRVYSDTASIFGETWSGLGNAETRYWTWAAMLHYHPAALSVHPEFLTQSDPEWLQWVGAHLGVTVETTPNVWAIMRDSEYPKVDWGTGGISGHPGDWTFWLYRTDGPGSQAPRVWRDDIPGAQDDVRSRQARKTDEDAGQPWISFDVDEAYRGDHWAMGLTILNRGGDTFAIEYTDAAGQMRRIPFTKGEMLGPVGEWVEVEAELSGAAMIGGLMGGADVRVNSEADGDEYVHMAVVFADYGGATPTATPTATRTASPTPTVTATPTAEPTKPAVYFQTESQTLTELEKRVNTLETRVAELENE